MIPTNPEMERLQRRANNAETIADSLVEAIEEIAEWINWSEVPQSVIDTFRTAGVDEEFLPKQDYEVTLTYEVTVTLTVSAKNEKEAISLAEDECGERNIDVYNANVNSVDSTLVDSSAEVV